MVLHDIRALIDGMEDGMTTMWGRVELDGKQQAIELVRVFERSIKVMKESWTDEVQMAARV